MDFRNPILDQLTDEEKAQLDSSINGPIAPTPQVVNAVLPQPSLEGRSPLAMPNFANKQPNEVIDMNNLFKGTPAFDPRVVPMEPDLMDMEPMTFESDIPKVDKLKKQLSQIQKLRAPASASESPSPAPQAKPESDDRYMDQGLSKIIQGLSTMGGGKIDDNSDFYNKYRQNAQEKPLRALELASKTKAFDKSNKMSDPTSAESTKFRSLVEATIPGIASKMKQAGIKFDSITADDKDSILDFGRLRENVDARLEAARLNAESRKDMREDNQSRKDLAREDKLTQQAKLSEKQVTDLTKLDQTIDLLDNIAASKPNNDTGPVSSRQNALAQMVGMDDSQKSAFKADVQSNVAEYIKGISGAAVSDTERAYLLQNMPNMTDNDATFMTKLNKVRDRMKRNRDTFLGNVKTSGKNTTEFERKGQEKSEKVDKSENMSKNKPKTVTQNGNTYTLNEKTGKYE